MNNNIEAHDLHDTLEAIDAVEAEMAILQTQRRRGSLFGAALILSSMGAALPGGVLYALYWGGGFAAAVAALSLPGRRKLRELKRKRSHILSRGSSGDE